MKSRINELIDKSINAMISSIEIYNKPNFLYRDETFSILLINSWELILKAKWLKENNNKLSCLYSTEKKKNKDGTPSKKKTIKLSRSRNPLTLSIDYLGKKLIETHELPQIAWDNIQAIIEFRDTSVHFYNHQSHQFSKKLLEIGTASIRNYVALIKKWFKKNLSEYNMYLLPLAFIQSDRNECDGIILNKEEKNFFSYIEKLNESTSPDSDGYSLFVNVEVKISKSVSHTATSVRYTNSPDATPVYLTETDIKDQYPMDYYELTNECRERYCDFKQNKKYHDIRKETHGDTRYSMTRFLNPSDDKSSQKCFYSRNIFHVLDEHYTKSQ